MSSSAGRRQHAVHAAGELIPGAGKFQHVPAAAGRQAKVAPWMTDVGLDPFGFDEAHFTQPAKNWIYPPFGDGESGDLRQAAADLNAIEPSVAEGGKHRERQTALAQLALPVP